TPAAASAPLTSPPEIGARLGAVGACVSMVIVSAADDAPTLPAASVARAVILWVASAGRVTSMEKAPEAFAVVVPSEVSPLNSSTRAFASALPVIVKPCVTLVTRSLEDRPLSSAAARARPVGAGGGVVSGAG